MNNFSFDGVFIFCNKVTLSIFSRRIKITLILFLFFISSAFTITGNTRKGTFSFLYGESKNAIKEINNGTIVHTIADNKVLVLPAVGLNQKQLVGTVKNEVGEALAGASIKIKGTEISATTDAKGSFSIGALGTATLVVTYLGYKSQEVPVNSRSTLSVTLIADDRTLDMLNVVATGYQVLNPKLFTGAATSLRGKDIIQEGTLDLGRALEGRVAGVSVQNVSGTFGAAPKIRIRGATSITGDNKPLWVIDGVILEDIVNVSNEQLSSGDASTLIGSSVAGLNMDDIEDINILKDAAATAQYGARAMNGVVVVRTKKGRVGKTQINYVGNLSTNLKPQYSNFNIMNSVDQMSVYSELERKGWFNNASTSRSSNGGVFTKMYNLIYDYDPATGEFALENTVEAKSNFLKRYALSNTDWFDLLFKNSLQQEHSISFSGGSETNQNYVSTSYLKDYGWAKGNNVERLTTNINSNYALSNKVTVNLITGGSIRNQKAPGTLGRVSNPVQGKYSRDFDINPFSYALNSSRVTTAYNEDGTLEYFTRNYAPFNILNELENNTMDLSMLDLKLQASLNYKIFDHLSFNTLGSLRYVKTEQEHRIREGSNMPLAYRAGTIYDPRGDDYTIKENNLFLYRDPENPAADPVTVLPYGGFYNTVDDFMRSYTFRNSLEYNRSIDDVHDFNVFLAQEIRVGNRRNKSNIGYGYQFDKGGVPFIDPNAISQAVANNLAYYGMGNQYDRQASFFVRGAYAYKAKYALNGTLRYDGSNRLGTSATARWLPTWNISGAWSLYREDFYANTAFSEVVNRFVLRGTYGLTASIGNATNSSLVVRSAGSLRPYKYEQETLINIINLANEELTWEKQYEANVGLDFGFLQDKVTLTVDLYDRRGFDLIYFARTAAIGGEYRKNYNYADMRSKGLEVSLGTHVKGTTNFSWDSNFNFGLYKNEVTNLKTNPNVFELVGADGGPLQGHPFRGMFSIPFAGLDPDSGIPNFYNAAGEKVTYVDPQGNDITALKYEGPIDPTFTGGFSNTLNYKNFSVFALFTFAAGNKVRLNPVFNSSYSDLDALPLEFKNRWTLPGDEQSTHIPALPSREIFNDLRGTYPYNSYNYSDQRVAKGDLLKLKTLRITYNLVGPLLAKSKLRTASLSLIANNFWLIYADKKLNGQDPEFFGSGGVALPVPKMYTLSLKVGL